MEKYRKFAISTYLRPALTIGRCVLLFAIGIWWSACTDDLVLPNRAPVVQIVGLSPDTARAWQDTLTLSFTYQDDNGDLGSPDPNRIAIELTDSRLPTPDTYALAPLLDLDSIKAIAGTIHLKIKPTFILGNQTQQQSYRYSLVLIDRAGNRSNTALSPTVTVIE